MGKLNLEAMKKAKERLERGGNSADFDKLANGKNVRRILWPKGESEICFSEGSIHFGLGEDGKVSMVCRKTANPNNRCPICEYISTLQRSKDKNDKKLAEAIRPRKRFYFNVFDRDNTNANEPEKIKIMAVGVKLQKDIISMFCDPDYGDVTDFDTGHDVTIRRSGQGLNTEYSIIPKPNATPASTVLSKEEIEESMPDLEALWNIPSIEDMENFLNGENSGDEDSDLQNLEGDANGYDDMELDELKELCEQRNIEMPEKISKIRLIMLLNQYDESKNKVGAVISESLDKYK